MGYSNMLKDLRIAAGLSQMEVAQKLCCSIMTVSQAERSYKETNRLPSELYIKKFVRHFAASPGERKELERKLMVERALITLPPVVAEQLKESLTGRAMAVSHGRMPMAFRKVVAIDWKKANHQDLPGFSKDTVRAIIDGSLLISRDDIIALATALKQEPDRYLFEADYMTDGLLKFYQRRGLTYGFTRRLNAMSKQDLDMIMDIFNYALDVFEKNGRTGGKKKPPQS
jgi:transcriptional regulator with XRE-family HTH domain